uniref:Uncharacterized protein n=1 Tax=Molossus molossus TaxID=27622 RepID=A0A7J8JW27_MOLMO|nr:hypothetical protein HJG59_007772 [Molossus molossus]
MRKADSGRTWSPEGRARSQQVARCGMLGFGTALALRPVTPHLPLRLPTPACPAAQGDAGPWFAGAQEQVLVEHTGQVARGSSEAIGQGQHSKVAPAVHKPPSLSPSNCSKGALEEVVKVPNQPTLKQGESGGRTQWPGLCKQRRSWREECGDETRWPGREQQCVGCHSPGHTARSLGAESIRANSSELLRGPSPRPEPQPGSCALLA